jgi:tRNA pseudouridine13 synthase
MPKNVYRLVVSAYQSWLFNRLLSDRVPEIGTLRDGDFAHLHDRGACFLVTDAAAEQPRADALEISPTAPLFGKKVRLAEGEPGREEQALLESEDLRLDDFQLPGLRLFGERRPLRVPVGGARVRADGEAAILVSFELPRGSFAACVLREVMKTDE